MVFRDRLSGVQAVDSMLLLVLHGKIHARVAK